VKEYYVHQSVDSADLSLQVNASIPHCRHFSIEA